MSIVLSKNRSKYYNFIPVVYAFVAEWSMANRSGRFLNWRGFESRRMHVFVSRLSTNIMRRNSEYYEEELLSATHLCLISAARAPVGLGFFFLFIHIILIQMHLLSRLGIVFRRNCTVEFFCFVITNEKPAEVEKRYFFQDLIFFILKS